MRPSQEDKRKFLRLKSVFPVHYTVLHLNEDIVGLDWQEGQTSNVGLRGICVETKDLSESVLNHLMKGNTLLELRIFLSARKKPIKAIGRVMWYQEHDNSNIVTVGIKFKSIAAADLRSIIVNARVVWIAAQVISALAVIVFIIILLAAMIN